MIKVDTMFEIMLVIMNVVGLKANLDSLILSVDVGLPKSMTKFDSYKNMIDTI